MKVYIASSFDLAEKCSRLETILKSEGIEIPDVWWNIKTKDDFQTVTDMEFYSNSLVKSLAVRHWKTISSVDAFILVSGEKERSFTGANVEVGYAIAKGIPVLSIGILKRSAMYSPILQCGSIAELLKVLATINMERR